MIFFSIFIDYILTWIDERNEANKVTNPILANHIIFRKKGLIHTLEIIVEPQK